MDIICISDKQRICPHCALFGNHRDHRFKRLEDFQKEVGEKRKVFQEISNEKQQLFKVDHYRIYEQLARKIELKKAQLLEEIEAEAKRHVDELLKAKQKAF
jgi:spore coat polysaccharide biosynthesis predicted glycosyltransferase SpsG